jgi:hypothetical protein
MSDLGHDSEILSPSVSSLLHPQLADINEPRRHFRVVPIADIYEVTRSTSSAHNTIDGGTVRAGALA